MIEPAVAYLAIAVFVLVMVIGALLIVLGRRKPKGTAITGASVDSICDAVDKEFEEGE